jgi:hypothetical protein
MPVVDLNQYAVGGAARPGAIAGLQPGFANSIADMFGAAPPNIQQQLRLTSAYRSPDRQAEILAGSLQKRVGPDAVAKWQNYVQQNGGDVVAAGEAARPWLRSIGETKWVAPPGSSNHQKGVAADLQYLDPSAVQWAHENAPKYGLNFPLGNEDWHLEPTNLRTGGQPSPTMQASNAAPTMANMHNKSFDPVGSVMANAQASAPQPTASIANMFTSQPPVGQPPVGQPPGAGMPDPSSGMSGLALMFAQQQADKQRQKDDQNTADQIRRNALLSGPAPSVAGLYG